MDKLERKRIEVIKRQFPTGTRVVLLSMDDMQAPQRGTEGTVINVDDMGTVHIKWDSGETLGAIIGVDRLRKTGEDKEKINIIPFYI